MSEYAAATSHRVIMNRARLAELIDYRDLAQDLWDRPKVLIDTATTAVAAGRFDLAEFVLGSAEVDLDRLADLADMVDPLPDPDDQYWMS